MPRVKTVPIAPLLVCTSLTPPNTPYGCGGKSGPDLAGGARVIGVFALAFCGEELREEKAKAKAPSREEGTASGARAGALGGGLREECGRIAGGFAGGTAQHGQNTHNLVVIMLNCSSIYEA